MNNFRKKAGQTFGQIILIITATFMSLSYFYFRLYQKANLAIGALIHKIKTACDCTQMALFSMHPFISGTLIALGLVFLSFFFYSVYKLAKLFIQTRKFVEQYLVFKKTGHSAKLSRILISLHINKSRIVEVINYKPVVFCYGIFKPKICLSNGLIKMLNQKELTAVLLHECQHQASYEPLKLFIIKYWQTTFFFLPVISLLAKKFFTFSELAADEQATDNFTDRAALAKALFKISRKEEKIMVKNALALSFFGSVIDARVNRLANDCYVPKFSFPTKFFLGGLLVAVFIPLFVFIILNDSTKVLAMHDYRDCPMNTKTINNESTKSMTSYSQNQTTMNQQNFSCKAE